MQIRPFTLADTSAVIALWTAAGLTRPWNDPEADVRRKLTVQPELFLVADDADSVVGVVMAGFEGHRGWLNYLAVADSHRGAGLGRALIRRAEAELMALGCPKVQLQVRPENEQAIAFYEHLGYAVEERIDMSRRLIVDDH